MNRRGIRPTAVQFAGRDELARRLPLVLANPRPSRREIDLYAVQMPKITIAFRGIFA
ncbi:MAG TPA: hypothetical protein VFQ54_05090 [Thermomicrobiales bacterium]|nr:hypothetical protein [Thermomicrobiales bacterium]